MSKFIIIGKNNNEVEYFDIDMPRDHEGNVKAKYQQLGLMDSGFGNKRSVSEQFQHDHFKWTVMTNHRTRVTLTKTHWQSNQKHTTGFEKVRWYKLTTKSALNRILHHSCATKSLISI